MPGPRDYSEATKKALFALSLGRCYARGCTEQVTQMDGDFPIVKVHIAHIRAARPNGPRYDTQMNDDDRRAFKNLILLCTFHHATVDGPETGKNYSVKELTSWKTEREGELTADLSVLTEDGLRELLGDNLRAIVAEMKAELHEQIAGVEAATGENFRLLRILVQKTFEQPYLDADLVASLADSSRMLGHLHDIAPMLYDASVQMRDLPDYAPMLHRAGQDLQILPDYVSMLDRTTKALTCLPDFAPMLFAAADKLPDNVGVLEQAIRDLDGTVADASRVLSDGTAVTALTSATHELEAQSDRLTESASVLAASTSIPEPDRMTWFLRGVVTTLAVLAVIGVLVVIIARSPTP